MAQPTNPYAPPEAPEAALRGARADLPNEDLVAERWIPQGKGRARVQFYPTSIALSPAEGHATRLSMHDFLASSEVRMGGDLLTVRLPKATGFALEPETKALVRAWLEPMIGAHMTIHLRKRFRFSVLIGLLVTASVVQSAGGLLQLGGLVFGIGLVVAGLLTLVRPHRSLWLADAALWVLMAINTLVAVASGGSPARLVFVLLALVFARHSFGMYRFYGPPTIRLSDGSRI